MIERQDGLRGAEGATSWFLTNRFNLLDILSSRIIAPRESYNKYYRDLLELTPGRVPLLSELPASSLIDYVSDGREAFPVLLELDVFTQRRERVWAVPATLARNIKAIHFPHERALREHSARVYDNVPDEADLLKVSPHLFQAKGGVDVAEVSGMSSMPSPVDWRWIDRWRGAVGAIALSANHPDAIGLLHEVLLGAPPSHWITRGVALDRQNTTGTDPDDVLFAASLSTFTTSDLSVDWSPRRVLAAISAATKGAAVSEDARALLRRNLDVVRQIIDNERDFVPFTDRPGGLDSAKALLLALLRPDPERMADWDTSETGASIRVQMAAMALVGALRGLARMSATRRTRALDDYSAYIALGEITASDALGPAISLTQEASLTKLTVDGTVIAQATLQPHLSEAFSLLPEPGRGAVAATIAETLGWTDAVSTLAIFESPVSVRTMGNTTEVLSATPPLLRSRVDSASMSRRLNNLTGAEKEQVLAILARASAEGQLPMGATVDEPEDAPPQQDRPPAGG